MGPLSVSSVNLFRSFSRPIDRSYRIDHLFLFLSLSLALSEFSIDYSVTSLSLALFYLFTRSFSRADALYRTTGDLRETRPYFAIVFSFCSAFVLLVTLFPVVTEPNTTAGLSRPEDFPAPLYAVRLLVVRTTIALFRARPPLQLRFTLHPGAPPTRIFPFLVSTRLILDQGLYY